MIVEHVPDVSILDFIGSGEYDVLAIGCSSSMDNKYGTFEELSKIFGNHKFPLEDDEEDPIDKLGRIDFSTEPLTGTKRMWIVNMYISFSDDPSHYGCLLDYDALRLCLRKLNMTFPNCDIVMPGIIGCGHLGGDPKIVTEIIDEEVESNVYLVYPKIQKYDVRRLDEFREISTEIFE